MKADRELLDIIGRLAQEGRISEGPGAVLPAGPTCKEHLPVGQSEDDFQADLIDYLHSRGWKVAHFRKARTKDGWRTAVAADGKGWPDLVCVRERLVFIEAKSETGKLSKEQKLWRQWLIAARAEWYCWRPSDWPEIRKVLT